MSFLNKSTKKKKRIKSGDKGEKKGVVVNKGEERGKPTNIVYATYTNGEKLRHSC